jgi:hypothetical protein
MPKPGGRSGSLVTAWEADGNRSGGRVGVGNEVVSVGADIGGSGPEVMGCVGTGCEAGDANRLAIKPPAGVASWLLGAGDCAGAPLAMSSLLPTPAI